MTRATEKSPAFSCFFVRAFVLAATFFPSFLLVSLDFRLLIYLVTTTDVNGPMERIPPASTCLSLFFPRRFASLERQRRRIEEESQKEQKNFSLFV